MIMGVLGLVALVLLASVATAWWRSRPRHRGAPFVRAAQRTFMGAHSTVRVLRGRWRNWSRELESRPTRLYCDLPGGTHPSPRTLADLQRIVRDARALGVPVRVFGSSHSWAALCPADGGFLVDNRMIGAVGDRYELSVEPPSADGTRKARATCPPGLISKEFEEWLWEMGYSLPASAFEDCFTMGGMASTATHGVGIDIPTVSDMVAGVTFVDGLGEVRRWDRESATEDEMAAAQCGLGCLGLVYSFTFEVEPRYEVVSETFVVPFDSLFGDTDEARRELREVHERYTTVELFWWPFSFRGVPFLSRMIINPHLWVLTTRRVQAEHVPRRTWFHKWLLFNVLDLPAMVLSGYANRVFVRFPQTVFLLSLGTAFTRLWVGARRGARRIPQYDANHLVNATGVEWLLCQSIEWSVPFYPGAADGAPDGYERMRRAFATMRAMVSQAFDDHHWTDPRSVPVTFAMEMRTLAPSSALLSPSYQPEGLRGAVRYAAPEIVSNADHPAWKEFAHRANAVMTADRATYGEEVRPHLAKQCRDFPHADFGEEGMTGYMREQYVRAGTWDRFLAVRAAVDPDGVFLNDFLREWFELTRASETEAGAPVSMVIETRPASDARAMGARAPLLGTGEGV